MSNYAEERAKILAAATYLQQQSEDRIMQRLGLLEARELFVTLVPLFEKTGMRIVEENDELFIKYRGKEFPLRGAQGIKGDKGDKGDTVTGPRGPRGFPGLDAKLDEGKLKALDEAVAKTKSIKIPRKEQKQPGNVVTGLQDDAAKAKADIELANLKIEFENFKQNVATEISSRMGKLALMMGSGGGGGGEVKLRRLDDVDMSDAREGSIMYYSDQGDGKKFKFAEKVLVGATGDILELDTFALTNQNVAPSGGALSISYLDGNFATISLTENVSSFGITDWPDTDIKVGKLTLIIKQAAGGNHTIDAWPDGTVWPLGQPPILTSVDGGIDIVILTTTDTGATIIGNVVGSNYS